MTAVITDDFIRTQINRMMLARRTVKILPGMVGLNLRNPSKDFTDILESAVTS